MFSVSPEIRADSCRATLALPGLPPSMRNRHLALLVHNLSVGGRVPEARELAADVRGPIKDSDDVRARFMLELAESGNFYAGGRFAQALALIELALISGESSRDLTRVMLTRQWHCDILMLNDRLDELKPRVPIIQGSPRCCRLRMLSPATPARARSIRHEGSGGRNHHYSRGCSPAVCHAFATSKGSRPAPTEVLVTPMIERCSWEGDGDDSRDGGDAG
jgi:hypothetical protein